MRRTTCIRLFAVAVVLLPAITRVALAQERSGNVFVQTEDTDGVPLPGGTIELACVSKSFLS